MALAYRPPVAPGIVVAFLPGMTTPFRATHQADPTTSRSCARFPG